MEWWQPLIGVVVGAALGFFVQQRMVREERAARHKAELYNAMQGLLVEIDENLLVAKKDPMAMLPIYPTDMWEVHKGKLCHLPLKLQESLQKAYASIKGMNDITRTALAYASTKYLGGFNDVYRNRVEKINEPLSKAREELGKWLDEQGSNKARSS